MKKLIALFLLFFSLSGSAQQWFDIGLKAGYGINFLLNQNMFDDIENNQKLATGYNYGGKIGWNFAGKNEITLDMMFNKIGSKIDFNITDTVTGSSPLYESSLDYKTTSFAFMYRMNSLTGSYFEVGPRYSKITSAGYSTTWDGSVYNSDAAEYMAEKYWGIVMGFGQYFFGTDNLGVTFGFQFSYGFQDIINETGQELDFPSERKYETYTKSTPFSALIMMEINYDLGYLTKSKCNNRVKLILF